MNLSNMLPLVSVGVPTYNRPEQLEIALRSLNAQTYPKLEIIISDNASSNPQVAKVIGEFARKNNRIRYFIQSSNQGAISNFLFVLEQAQGEYFMWAADDDEWAPDFVEVGVREIGSAGLVMGDIETRFYMTGKSIVSTVPSLDPELPLWVNAQRFIANMQPSLIYGIHRTSVLRQSIPQGVFDFWDCALVFRVLMRSDIKTIRGARYVAGVHTYDYEVKLVDPSEPKLTYGPFLHFMLGETLRSSYIPIHKKLLLSLNILALVWRLRKHHKARVLEQNQRKEQ
jgi:glycosyltransferase involved in cell wall biosynthesis